jgi:hypothetical protein
VLLAIGEGVGRRATYVLIVGRTLLLYDLIDRLAAAALQGPDAQERGGSGGFGLLPLLLLGGIGFVGYRAWRRSRSERAAFDDVREAASEDATSLANDIYDLELELTDPNADAEAGRYHEEAIAHYSRARRALERARRPQDLAEVTEALEEGRYAIACARARLAGRPLPEHRPPCFFNPTHGPSSRDVEWAPRGGSVRTVPACEADAQRVEAGDEPGVREVSVAGARRPYWDAPSAFGPWAGGYYGAFGGFGFLQGMLFGSLLGGWGPGFGAGWIGGGTDDLHRGGLGGDFGGGDFGGDFGGGDFGGGDF